MLISPEYLDQQKELHARGNYGVSSGRWATTVSQIAHMYGCEDILDYGCGTGQLKAALGAIVREYDPCIAGKDADPVPADMIVCTDVLEHIEPALLYNVLVHLASKIKKAAFLTVALRPAKKVLADGRNAHLILQPGDWWIEQLSRFFSIARHECKEGRELTLVALAEGVQPVKTGIRANKERRKLSRPQRRQFKKFFEQLRQGSKRYSDPLWTIDTFSFWEGVDDEPADIQCVVDILEHQWDVDAALTNIKQFAKHAALICVRPDFRGKDYWHNIISQYFMITETVEDTGMISFVANIKTLIPGAKIKVAGTDESRWENIEASTRKYKDFVQEASKHQRRALIGCYGPSLKETWPHLKEQAQDPNNDVVSVSGAHDFLLDKGIIPRFHIECDPRPHKADNIKEACSQTEYLLSSIVHPKLFDKLAGAKIRLWHSVSGQEAVRIVEELKSPAPLIFGGGSVGLRSIPVMFRMGYRDMFVYGMDCSCSATDKWAGPHANKQDHKEHQTVRVRYNGREFLSTGILLSYGTDFFDMMNRMLQADQSLQVRLFGDGLLQARVSGPQEPIEVIEFMEAAA